MWIRFCYDASIGAMNFKPGDHVEVPDVIVRRWQLVHELFVEAQREMSDWKARSWNTATQALPASLHALQIAEEEREAEMLAMNGIVSRIAQRERAEALNPRTPAGVETPRRRAPKRAQG